MFTITLKNNKTFECSENDTLMEGARKSGIILEHSCLSGRCSSCRVMVDAGLSEPTTDELALSDNEKDLGYILSCVRAPKSDMVIQAEDLSEYKITAPKTWPAKINKIEKLTDDVLKVELRFPPTQPLNFLAGQYVNVDKREHKKKLFHWEFIK